MRDLEKQISEWRRSMAQTSKHRPEALDELETHLREEIERLMRTGNSADEAFKVATSRIGSPDALGAEFQKLEQLRRAKWMPATLAQWGCGAVALLVALFIATRIGHGRTTPLLATHVLTVTIGYVMMFIMGGLAICHVFADWFHRTGTGQTYALRRTMFRLATISAALTSIGIVLGMVWAKDNWGRYWAWDAKEMGAVTVLVCAVLTGALGWIKPASHNAIVVMGIVGNIGTAWGWFGMNAHGNFGPILVVFIASQCVLVVAFSATTLIRRRLRPQTL